MFKSLAIASIGALSALTIPAIASIPKENPISLNKGQIEFINTLDRAGGTTLSSLVNTPGANQIIKSATLACGNIELQKKSVIALGGTEKDAFYASKQFETKFCGN